MPRRAATSPTLTAAATRIDLRAPKRAAAQMGQRQGWQAEAWQYSREIPEIHEALRYRADQLGKVKLFVAIANPEDPDGDPIPVSDESSGVPPAVAAAADAELGRLRSALGGQSEIMRMLDRNLEAVGECFLIGIGPRQVEIEQRDGSTYTMEEPENWVIRSISEVEVKGTGKGQKVIVKADENDTKGTALDPEQDTWIRIWLRDPQWSDQPECGMRALLGECRIVQVLTQQLLALCYRALSAGLFLIPNEMSQGPMIPTEPGEDPPADPLDDTLYEVFSAPVEDPSHPSTVQPATLRGPKDAMGTDVLRHLSFYDAAQVAGIEERITARVVRIARGLSLPVEGVQGKGDTTFANARQIAEDEWNKYLSPSAGIATNALTYAFLLPQLRENPAVPPEWGELMFIAADPSDLMAEADTKETANDAWDRGTISDDTYRKAKGFSEDDKPEPVELLIRAALRRGILTADLTLALMNLLGVPIEVESSAVADVVPADASTQMIAEAMAQLASAHPRSIRAASRPTTDYGRRLTDIDRELRTRVLAATNAAMGAALDRAANRLSSRAAGTPSRAVLNSVHRRHRFAQLGPALVADIMGDEDPLSGAWADLEADYMAWGADAQSQARTVAGEATGTDQSGLRAEQDRNLTDSWGWMAGALTTLANERIWDPSPKHPDVGEFDPSLTVPPGLARAAIARAGGADGLTTGGTGAWVTLTDGGTRPAGGIATGETIRDALREGGATVDGYEWTYGPAFRRSSFQPHLDLNGTVVANFDDDRWSGGGWTGFGSWFPGDHHGSLVAGTVVSGPAPRGAALRHWRGDLVDLSFASGQFLSATPNHPVLTRRGWVAAGALVEGDEVIRCVDAEGVAGLIPDDHQVPARIEDVVAAVAVSPSMIACPMEVAPMNFHGDGEGSEVAVVWTDRLLWDRHQASIGQPTSEDLFSGADADPKFLPGSSRRGELSGGVGLAPLRSVGGSGHGLPLLRGPALVDSELGGAVAAGLNASGQELPADDVPIDAESLGQSVLGLAAFVEGDKVLYVDRRRGFSGHVYDLQTAPRWYVANGVIVHNCSCDFTPVILPAQ